MLEANKQVVLGSWEVANSHNANGFDDYYAEDVVYHGTDGEVRGRENVKAYLQTFMTALPDIKLTVEDIFGEVAGVYPRIMQEGDLDAGAWSCGMVVGLINDVPSCRELVDRIMAEAEAIIRDRLTSALTSDL